MKLTEKQENCPYCHGWAPLISTFDESVCLFVDSQQNLRFRYDFGEEDEFGAAVIGINYCPICGRPLKEEEE